jgi:large subunit ribosomal protein L15
MIRLEQLHGDKGARQQRKRVGRGESSGQGRTSGKGNKGAQARTGTPKGKHFEGGQTPITRRVPKRGFSRANWRPNTRIINLNQLNRFEDGAEVNLEALTTAGLVGSKAERVKILGNGELKKKLTVVADAFSDSAKQKIEAVGGQIRCTSPAAQAEEGKAE